MVGAFLMILLNLFTKIFDGIHYFKLDNKNILICLIDKTIEGLK